MGLHKSAIKLLLCASTLKFFDDGNELLFISVEVVDVGVVMCSNDL